MAETVTIKGNPYRGLSEAYEEGFSAGRDSVIGGPSVRRLDHSALLVVEKSLQVALSCGSNYISPLHLILAALEANPTLADELGVTPEVARQAVARERSA